MASRHLEGGLQAREWLISRMTEWRYDPPGDECIRWPFSTNPKGYALVTWEGVGQGAHRVVFQQLLGGIPEGMEIDHTCRVRDCINPRHLSLVTHTENVRRRRSGRLNRLGNGVSSKYKGVYFHRRVGRWASAVGIGGYQESLGYYDTELEAARAYDLRVIKLLGKDAVTNSTLYPEDADLLENTVPKRRIKGKPRRNKFGGTPSSKYTGVCYYRRTGKWQAGSAGHYIGVFASEKEAAKAYDEWLTLVRGEAVVTNQMMFPEDFA